MSPVDNLSKSEQPDDPQSVEEKRYVHREMNESRMQAVRLEILLVHVVLQKIKWRYDEIVHVDLQAQYLAHSDVTEVKTVG